ncbi:MAG: DNA adenine methylase [Anaerolineaceae bacterium]|nr:DNA adenine methylase [Anaerolineaceae bacterium]
MTSQKTLPLYSRRAWFLDALKSSGRLEYKRYLGSPLRYAGGKSLAVGFVVELIPDRVERLVSPFFGGGSVEIACARELGMEVVAYDVFDILCNYWAVQLDSPEALYTRLKTFTPDRETFRLVKKRLNAHWREGKSLGRLDLAAHYYFNSNTSYGPHFLGWPSDVYLNTRRYDKMLEKLRCFRAGRLTVGCAGFEETIPRHQDELLYCDPPYYLEDGKTFVGMYPHRNFPIHHAGFRHEKLRDLLLSHQGGFILSYNDCDTIRDWYGDCGMRTPKWQYTFGQGDTRIGKNRQEQNGGSHVKKSHELLIWKLPAYDKA